MKGITWLASYPKSGNTWLRAVLTHYRIAPVQTPSLHSLIGGGTAVLRSVFEDITGLEAESLSWDQLMFYRRVAYEALARDAATPLFLKVHDAAVSCADGQPLFSGTASTAAVCLVRSPFDVACSFAYHRQRSLDNTIAVMGNGRAMLDGWARGGPQLPQILLSWQAHVQSWRSVREFPVLVVRYEDLIADPLSHFGKIITFCGMDLVPERLRAAVEWARFGRLHALESTEGFPERQPTAPRFFRSGTAGGWQSRLNRRQVDQLVSDHEMIMRDFGYLPTHSMHPSPA